MKTSLKEKLMALTTLVISCLVTMVLATGILGLGNGGGLQRDVDFWSRVLL